MQKYQCSLADRERVLVYSLTVVLDEFLKNYSKVADSGTVSHSCEFYMMKK